LTLRLFTYKHIKELIVLKRSLALIISLFLLVTALFPLQTLAAEDKGLQDAITTAKSLLDISDDYNDFDYYSNTYGSYIIINIISNVFYVCKFI
jgi:hypothetical protein